MNLLLASSEIHPYSKTGGLGDMVAGLAKSLARAGHEVALVTPLYAGIRERFPSLRKLDGKFDLPIDTRRVTGGVWKLEPAERLSVYFVEHDQYYNRPGLYQNKGADYPDNAERFIFFAKAVVQLARRLPGPVEMVHCHDWQAGLVPVLIRHEKLATGWGTAPRTCLTIHNLAYQGMFPGAVYPLLNLPWEYFTHRGLEYYGHFNCLKAGIVFSDVVTTVSPRYAREITTPEFGCGLDGLLRERQSNLIGILNGVDYDEWNTDRNPFVQPPYSATDLSGKTGNKLALQKEFGLPAGEAIPLFGNVSRLVEQKGSDLILAALEEMLASDMQFVMLGSGTAALERAFLDQASRYPQKMAVRTGYDHRLAHLIEAGCDFFLMPSRFEPCGLNQMYSLRYGTIPIVRRTGGLDDSVIDAVDDVWRANGIKFTEASGGSLAKAIRKALVLFHAPEALALYRHNGMAADFAWDQTARQYERTYRKMLGAA